MRPLLHAQLVNGRFGDPALYVERQFERRAFLFDLGDISLLSARSIQRLEHVFVSHTHIDHFFGFERLLRILVGREKTICLYGPTDFTDQVAHKLHAYRWNLVERYAADLVFVVNEVSSASTMVTTKFRLKTAFTAEAPTQRSIEDSVLYADPALRITTAILDHGTPCLGFAIEETQHVNVWKNRLAERGLPVGPWLRDLKQAIVADQPDDFPITVDSARTKSAVVQLPLGSLRELVTITRGQKIAYVTDVADTTSNRRAIVELAADADTLFIEAVFAQADAARASDRGHLTTVAAGEIGRAARARRLAPFHFSHRYEGGEAQLLAELKAAFGGEIN